MLDSHSLQLCVLRVWGGLREGSGIRLQTQSGWDQRNLEQFYSFLWAVEDTFFNQAGNNILSRMYSF